MNIVEFFKKPHQASGTILLTVLATVIFLPVCASFLKASSGLAFSAGLSGEEKRERVLLRQQKVRQDALEYEAEERQALTQQLAGKLTFPLIGTYPMETITAQGIMDLAWDGTYLWALDGGAFEETCYIDKIDPSDFSILEYFEAPGERIIAHGVSGIACARGYLWVVNFLDGLIYAVEPSIPYVDLDKTIILPAYLGVISGGCYDGEHLWFAEWGTPAHLYKVDIDGKVIIKDISLSGYEYADDLTYMHGSLWITATDINGYHYYLRVDPDSGSIQERYERSPCSSGITFTDSYLIVANWFWLEYYKYDTEQEIIPPTPSPPPTGGDGGCFIDTLSSR